MTLLHVLIQNVNKANITLWDSFRPQLSLSIMYRYAGVNISMRSLCQARTNPQKITGVFLFPNHSIFV